MFVCNAWVLSQLKLTDFKDEGPSEATSQKRGPELGSGIMLRPYQEEAYHAGSSFWEPWAPLRASSGVLGGSRLDPPRARPEAVPEGVGPAAGCPACLSPPGDGVIGWRQ
jgi:hypothetical protein